MDQGDVGGARTQIKKKTSPKRETTQNVGGAQSKTRCFNCSKFDHMSKECKAPKREKGICFKCGEKGHLIGECTSATKVELSQVNSVNVTEVSNNFQR